MLEKIDLQKMHILQSWSGGPSWSFSSLDLPDSLAPERFQLSQAAPPVQLLRRPIAARETLGPFQFASERSDGSLNLARTFASALRQ